MPHLYKSLYKRELLLKNLLLVADEIQLGDEMTCVYPAILDAKKIVIISECFYHYRMREGSLMDTNDGKNLWRFKIVYKYLRERFSEKITVKESLLNQLDYLMVYCLLLKEINVLQNSNELFPYSKIKEGGKIIVYGAGRFGNNLVKFIKSQQKYSLIAWVDESGKVDKIDNLKELDYDYILIGVLLHDIAEEIEKKLLQIGISKSKIRRIDEREIEIVRKKVANILG